MANKAKGVAHVKVAPLTFSQYTTAASDTWTIDHNMNAAGIIAQFYDNDDMEIVPKTFTLSTQDQCVATWSTPVSGYILLDYVERVWTFDTIIDSIASWKVGTGGSITYNITANNDLETVVSEGSFLRDMYEDDDFYYFDFEVPLTVNDLEITEMGLFSASNIMFYTTCSPLHKPSSMALTVHYRIEKKI